MKKRELNTKSLRQFQPAHAYSSSSYSGDECCDKTITSSTRPTPYIIQSPVTSKALQQQIAVLEERINFATAESELEV